MQIKKEDLKSAVNAKLITKEQADQLWNFWHSDQEDVPSFRFAHVMYYFGGFLAISAVTLFVTQAWDALHGLPLCILSSLLILLGLFLTQYFLDKKLRIPAGIMATFSLVLVPLAIYNMQLWLGYQPPLYDPHYADYHYYVSWYWMPMELGTLIIGAVMFYYMRFPFLLFPISVTLWYMSMDLFPLLTHLDQFSWNDRAIFSMYFGLAILLIAVYLDFKYGDNREDYAFWLYIFGVMAFWGGLSSLDSHSELSKFIYCLINIVMILVSVFLDRRVFAIFGALGILGYLGHLSMVVFPNSLSFPIILVFLGILIILAATRWAAMERKLNELFLPYIPEKIRRRKDLN